MNNLNRSHETWERRTLLDYIRDCKGTVSPRTEVDEIIRLAITSALRISPASSRKPEVALAGTGGRSTPAFEHRIVALFGD
jgi:hypothetical protein